MSSTTRILLPVGLLFAIIFGITFISNNTNTAPVELPKAQPTAGKRPEPLLFGITNAEPDPKSPQPALRNMTVDWDIGAEGQFDFWFVNPNAEVAKIYLQGKSCTCAGAKLGLVPAESTRAAVEMMAAASLGHPLLSLGVAPFATQELIGKIDWKPLSIESDTDIKEIPPAGGDLPQLGVLRVTFSSKKPGDKRRINAKVMSMLPNSTAVAKELSVVSRVGPTMMFWTRKAPGAYQADMGVLYPGDVSTRELYLFSFVRPELELKVNWLPAEDRHPCLSFAPPQPLSGEEFNRVVEQIDAEVTLGPAKIRSLYKVNLTVRERLEDPRQPVPIRMELGPFEKTLAVTLGDGSEFNNHRIGVRGVIRGELSIVSTTEDRDRIDFGKSINAVTGETREVELVSSAAGIDAELLPGSIVPSYLQVEMKLKSEVAGKKSWILSVRIPPGKLNGALPRDAVVVLQLKGASQQKVRVPIVGTAVESGRQF